MAVATRLDTSGNYSVAGYFDETTIGAYSMNFAGTGSSSYVQAANQSLNFLSNGQSWTVETWFYKITSSATGFLFSSINSILSNPTGMTISVLGSGSNAISASIYSSAALPATTATTTSVYTGNTWNHVAVTFNGSYFTFFVNGNTATISANSGTSSFNNNNPNQSPTVGTNYNSSANPPWTTTFNGQLAGFRVSNSVIYTANFTPTFASTTTSTANTKLLLSYYPSLPIYDRSSLNAPVSAGSNTTLSTNMPPSFVRGPVERISNTGVVYTANIFDEITSQNAYLGSITFSTANSNYLQVASNTAFQLNNAGGITVEMWIYPTSSTTLQGFVGYNAINTGGSTDGGWMFSYNTVTGQVVLDTYQNNSAAATTALNSNAVHLTINSWQHIAFTANSTYGNIWINGANVAYGAIGGTTYGAAVLRVGAWNYSVPRFFNGNIADLRITSNTMLYTSNFTPPTLKLTALANTQLLLSTPYGSPQANTFSDFSSFARTVTLNGTGAPVSNNYSPTLTNVPTLLTPPMRLYSNGAVQILGAFDEVNKPI